jgi:ribonuclease J
MMAGAEVIYGKEQGIHVSGHGAQEDQKLMLSLTRPKFFLPVHGEHRMLVKHSQTAQSMGIPAENMVIINNGDTVELTETSIRRGKKVPAGIELVSNNGMVRGDVLKQRQQLAEDGIVTIAATIGWDGRLVTKPDVHLRGVVTTIEPALLQGIVHRTIADCLDNRWKQFVHVLPGEPIEVDWAGVKAQIETELRRLLKRELRGQSLLVFLMQVPEHQPASVVRQPASLSA